MEIVVKNALIWVFGALLRRLSFTGAGNPKNASNTAKCF